MRLFIAIDFPGNIKKDLLSSADILREASIKGSFSVKENFHITLAFLGEVNKERLGELKCIMDGITLAEYPVTIGHFGRKKGKDGDLYYRTVSVPERLKIMREELAERLKTAGFKLDEKPFNAHITVGRRVLLKEGRTTAMLSEKVPGISYTVSEIVLMESVSDKGKVRYVPLYKTVCKKDH